MQFCEKLSVPHDSVACRTTYNTHPLKCGLTDAPHRQQWSQDAAYQSPDLANPSDGTLKYFGMQRSSWWSWWLQDMLHNKSKSPLHHRAASVYAWLSSNMAFIEDQHLTAAYFISIQAVRVHLVLTGLYAVLWKLFFFMTVCLIISWDCNFSFYFCVCDIFHTWIPKSWLNSAKAKCLSSIFLRVFLMAWMEHWRLREGQRATLGKFLCHASATSISLFRKVRWTASDWNTDNKLQYK